MEVVSNGQWTESEAGQSSTWRELAAVLQVLLGVAKKLIAVSIGSQTTKMLLGY